MSPITSLQHMTARQYARAALVAIAAFIAALLFQFLFAVALFGLHETFAPIVLGLFGPPLIDMLLRPFVVMAVVVGGVSGVGVFLASRGDESAMSRG